MASSSFRHTMCDECWYMEAIDRIPVRLVEEIREWETCCNCGKEHKSGIIIRATPNHFPCKGEHDESEH